MKKQLKILLIIIFLALIIWYAIFGRLLIKELKFKRVKYALTKADTYIEIRYVSSNFVFDANLLKEEEIYKITPQNEMYVYKSDEVILHYSNFFPSYLLIQKPYNFISEKSRYNLADKVILKDNAKEKIYQVIIDKLDEYKICDLEEYQEPEMKSIGNGKVYLEPSPISFEVNGKMYYDIANEAYLVNIPSENISCFANKQFIDVIKPILNENI